MEVEETGFGEACFCCTVGVYDFPDAAFCVLLDHFLDALEFLLLQWCIKALGWELSEGGEAIVRCMQDEDRQRSAPCAETR